MGIHKRLEGEGTVPGIWVYNGSVKGFSDFIISFNCSRSFLHDTKVIGLSAVTLSFRILD